MPTAWILTAVCALLTAESVRRYLAKRPTPGWVVVALRRGLDGGLPHLGRRRRDRARRRTAGRVARPRRTPRLRRPRRRPRRAGGCRQHRHRRPAPLRRVRRGARGLARPARPGPGWSRRWSPARWWRSCWASSRSPTSSTRSSSAWCSTCSSSASPASCSARCWPPNAATLNSPPRFPRVPIPVLGDIPLIGPDLLPPDRDRLPALHRGRAGDVRALPHPVGPARARGRRAPEGRRHGGHQGQPHPLPHHPAGRRHRRHGRRVLHPGLGPPVQPRDDRRCGLHRPGRGHLRQVGPDPGDPGRAALRLRVQPPGRARGPRVARARASSC